MSEYTTRTWVAQRGSARGAAFAFWRYVLRRNVWHWRSVVLWLFFSGVYAVLIDARYGVGRRVLFGAIYATYMLVPICILVLAGILLLNWNNARRLYGVGTSHEMSTSDEALFYIDSHGAELKLPYTAMESIHLGSDWVIFRHGGTRNVYQWPRALFSEYALEKFGRSSVVREQPL